MSLQASFDKQAKVFDKRAGISDQDCQSIVDNLAHFYKQTNQNNWLEIGTGTGQIGHWALRQTEKYIGMDISEKMLDEFKGRVDTNKQINLFMVDANNQWPVESQSVSLTFSSRTIHLLSPNHVFNEIKRVHQGGYFLIGRLGRDTPDNIKDTMRAKMREILGSLGKDSRRGEQNRKQLLDLFCEKGAKKIRPIIVTSWLEKFSPQRSIDSWSNKDGLAGQDVDHTIKKECMKRLRAWAENRYGSVNYEETLKQMYIIEGVNLTSFC